MFSEPWSFSLFIIFYKGDMSTPMSLVSEHMFCPPAGWSTLGGISVCFCIRRCLWVWATDWRCWNNTRYFVFIVSKAPPPYLSPNPVSNGSYLNTQFGFSSLQIIHAAGLLYLKLSWGTFVFEAQNDMKSQESFFSLANLKAEGRCWKQKNHSLNSPGVDQRGSHKLQQRQRSTLLWKLASNTGNVSLFIPLILW